MTVQLVYRLMHNLIMGNLILLFYQKITKIKFTKNFYMFCILLLFTFYMFCSYDYIMEPFRIIIGGIIFGFMLWLTLKKLNWAALILAAAFAYAAWMISTFISAIPNVINELINRNISEPFYYVTGIIIELIMCFAFYKYPKLKNGIPYINDTEIKGIIYCITGIILSLYSGFRIATGFSEEYQILLVVVSSSVIIFIIAGLIFLIRYFSKKHRDKLETDKQFEEFEQVILKLERDCEENLQLYKDERSENHKFKNVIPAMTSYCGSLLNDLQTIRSERKIIPLANIQKRLDELNEFAAELTEGFESEAIKNMIETLDLPEGWSALELYLKQSAKDCVRKGVLFSCVNMAEDDIWETIPKTKFICLTSNLLSNAIKELNKTDTTGKQILLKFTDTNGAFQLEIRDNAHEFPIDILSGLGERGNSTNGTGDGYAEIFEFLSENASSLIITENSRHGECDKSIRAVFDGNARVVIRTNYRYEILKEALASTSFELENLS